MQQPQNISVRPAARALVTAQAVGLCAQKFAKLTEISNGNVKRFFAEHLYDVLKNKTALSVKWAVSV